MVHLYIDPNDISSKLPWFFVKKIGLPDVEVIDFEKTKSNLLLTDQVKSVPFLVDDDIWIFGCVATTLYLAEKYDQHTLYSDIASVRAKQNSILFWLSSTFFRNAILNFALPKSNTMFSLDDRDNNNILLEHSIATITENIWILEDKYFGTGKNLCGNEEFVGDFFLAFILEKLSEADFKLDTWPKTKEWFDSIEKQITGVL